MERLAETLDGWLDDRDRKPSAPSEGGEGAPSDPGARVDEPFPALPAPPVPSGPHPWDDLIEGPENRLALACLRLLARSPSDPPPDPPIGPDSDADSDADADSDSDAPEPIEAAWSPLVLHGPSGVGKTVLLDGFVRECLQRDPGRRVLRLDASAFIAACVEAVRNRAWRAFRARTRDLDVLIFEDVPGLARSPLAAREAVAMLDDLRRSGAIVVGAASARPGDWPAELPRHLVDRWEGGLALRLEPPGPESLRRHALRRARLLALRLAPDAIEALVRDHPSYRGLDGALARLKWKPRLARAGASASASQFAPSRTDGDPDPADNPVPTLAAITEAVARRYGVPSAALRGADRRQTLAEPRHLAMYLARRRGAAGVAAIGRHFGGRDPATVRHACGKIEERARTDPALLAVIASLLAELGAPAPITPESPRAPFRK